MNYQEQALAGATGVDLILALYDGAVRFLYRAIRAVEEEDVVERRFAVKRALDILMYLQARLRPDIGGAPAISLADFYAAMFKMTLEASFHASKEEFLGVIACIRNVREAWVVVAQDPAANRALPRELRTAEEKRSPASLVQRKTAVAAPSGRSAWSA
ncbi:flagellar export chaperone FliS [Terriglobus saanensis]|uniref:Flagellar protein FliS n=1 Tax=Terriglobus saanensis (strain ATCC BAA-1853 / DSM 23119 / SP1PR4) TaxID=401053 RepID=E8UWZ3_TERSS|nr:flagellar export chaperone FliS [Terriglobus saanensis]ADV81880.1 flagellar protein FliS [Terriglobus saanensis SP1PR4]